MEEPLFAKDNENHGNNCEVPTNVLMEFILSEGAYVLSGYALDINENLRIDTAVDLEQYGEGFVERGLKHKSEEPGQPSKAPKKEGGREKWCRIANKLYLSSEFWRHWFLIVRRPTGLHYFKTFLKMIFTIFYKRSHI